MQEDHEAYMEKALHLACKAESEGEVPVGAVLVYEGRIIGEGWNQSITTQDPTAHAEIVALRRGARTLGNYRLINTTLYVTLEPCLMCMGALVHARVKHCVYGAKDSKVGAVHHFAELREPLVLNHHVEYREGVLAEKSSAMLKAFFEKRRLS